MSVERDRQRIFLKAAVARDWEAADRLLRDGADIHGLDPSGRYDALQWVLDFDFSREAVEGLLARGADPNRPLGPIGERAVHVAARRRRAAIVDVLARAGADLDAKTTGGMTAYRHALRRDFPEVAEALRAAGARAEKTVSDDLAIALHAGELPRARAILARHPALGRSETPEEARLLPDLAAWGKRDAVEILLDAGADIAARGLDDGTALHQAAWFGQPEVARLLLDRGAPLDVVESVHDGTPLGWVAHGSRYADDTQERTPAYVAIATLLLEAGARFPEPGDPHDPQLSEATAAVQDVFRRYGWQGAAR